MKQETKDLLFCFGLLAIVFIVIVIEAVFFNRAARGY